MGKMRNFISFSSFLEEKRYHTAIDLVLEVIKVHQDGELIFEGSIKEFKALEKLKAHNTDKVYEDLLRMSEELMEILIKE